MKSKKGCIVAGVLGISILTAFPSFAGAWKEDSKGWWYQNDDGTYPFSTWKWIDGNQDGVMESYYFDSDGYMLADTVTPDNYTVNSLGAWTVNGVVQTKASSSNEWKQAYIAYVNKRKNDSGTGRIAYKLVNINNDNIPELYINFGSTADGDVICTYDNGNLDVLWMYNDGFSYIEGQNLFRDEGGHMDEYYDAIYSIENGKFVLRVQGEYGAADNSRVKYDSNGEPIYNYYWNNTEVSSNAQYENLLKAAYNENQATNPFDGAEYDMAAGRYVGNGICNYDEIIQAINAY